MYIYMYIYVCVCFVVWARTEFEPTTEVSRIRCPIGTAFQYMQSITIHAFYFYLISGHVSYPWDIP